MKTNVTPGSPIEGYPVPAAVAEVEEVVRRSRFHTMVARASSREAALDRVELLRQRHPGATHYCWAFNAGPPGRTHRIGLSDDGEPHGTAGRPMLRVLLGSGIGEIVAVCARDYGGIRLGRGGLARAYGGGVRLALDRCSTTLKVATTPVLIVAPWDSAERVERILPELGLSLLERAFADGVRYRALAPTASLATVRRAIAEATAGRASLTTEADCD